MVFATKRRPDSKVGLSRPSSFITRSLPKGLAHPHRKDVRRAADGPHHVVKKARKRIKVTVDKAW